MSDAALGMGYSVYFLLGLVFALIGGIAFIVIRTIRREQKRERERDEVLK